MEIKISVNVGKRKVAELTEGIDYGETSVSGATGDILEKITKSLEKEGVRLGREEKTGLLIKILNGLVAGKKIEIALNVKPVVRKDKKKPKNGKKTKKPKKDESKKSRDSI